MQNLTPLDLSSAEKSVTVQLQTHKITNKQIRPSSEGRPYIHTYPRRQVLPIDASPLHWLHQLLYRLSRDNLKHSYLPNLTHDFKLLSHICVSCPRRYLRFIPRGKIYTTLISTFCYYYTTTTTTITCTILIPMFSVFMFPLPWDSHGHSIPVHTSKYIQCLPMCTTSCEDSHNPCVNSTCIPDVMAMPARECVCVCSCCEW